MLRRYMLSVLRAWADTAHGEFIRRTLIFTRNSLSLLGLGMIGLIMVSVWKPELRSKVFFWSPVQAFFSSEVQKVGVLGALSNGADWLSPPIGQNQQLVSLTPGLSRPPPSWETMSREQRRVSQYLAVRYRIGRDASEALVRSAYLVARNENLDAMLILAVAGVESSFNPLAASDMGAQGLMQVMTQVHGEKFESLPPTQRSAFHPVGSMQVGARILRNCLDRTRTLDSALSMYVGAANSGNHGGYPDKVKAERERMRRAANGVSVAVLMRQLLQPPAPVKPLPPAVLPPVVPLKTAVSADVVEPPVPSRLSAAASVDAAIVAASHRVD
ncbi:MAG: lytic transglycosylase domain-containing protein [Burkholderiaceae bacterium]